MSHRRILPVTVLLAVLCAAVGPRPGAVPAARAQAGTGPGLRMGDPAPPPPGAGPAVAQKLPGLRVGLPRRYDLPLPDSVLVRLGNGEDVTVRRFQRAVRVLGANPDTLTAASREVFLQRIIEQRLLASAALRSNLPWSAEDSARFAGECDHIRMSAALALEFDSLEARRRAQGLPDLDANAMGIAARESLATRSSAVWDDALVTRVAAAFAALPEPDASRSAAEQLRLRAIPPTIDPADSARALVTTGPESVRVSDVLAAWTQVPVAYRPRVSDAEGVRALAANVLFERHLRTRAERPETATRPEVSAAIEDRREYHAASNWLQRDVVARIPTDSLTLRRHWERERIRFTRAPRAVVVLVALDDEAAARAMAERFRVPGEAESLAFRAQRDGVYWVYEVIEGEPDRLYEAAAAAGVNGVVGPDRTDDGWRVMQVRSLTPRETPPFEAVRDAVARDWLETESERRIRDRLADLARRTGVRRNERALRAIVLSPDARPR